MISLLAALAISQAGQEPLLQDLAPPIADASSWGDPTPSLPYIWWTSNKLLVRLRSQGTWADAQGIFDLETRKMTPFPLPLLDLGYCSGPISPNRSMVVDGPRFKDGKTTFNVKDLSGKKLIGAWTMISNAMPPDSVSGGPDYLLPRATWSADSQSIYQIDAWPEGEKWFAIVAERQVKHIDQIRFFPGTQILEHPWDIIVFDHKALVYGDFGMDRFGGRMGIKVQEWSLDDPKGTAERWTIKAPKGWIRNGECELSPNHDRWLFEFRKYRTNYATTGGYPYSAVSLWQCGLHGDQMTEIGVFPLGEKEEEASRNTILCDQFPHWQPDGKHISFIIDHKLYVVPA